MPDIKMLCPDGKYREYTGVESITVESATPEEEPVKFIAIENPITLVVEGVDYTLENATGFEEIGDTDTYAITLK